jgi:hypothetical protein
MPDHFTLTLQHSTPVAYREKRKFNVIYRHKPLMPPVVEMQN